MISYLSHVTFTSPPGSNFLHFMCFRGTGEEQQQEIFHPGGCLQQFSETKVLQHEVDLRWDHHN